VDNFFGFENIRAVERKSGCLAQFGKKCYNVIDEKNTIYCVAKIFLTQHIVSAQNRFFRLFGGFILLKIINLYKYLRIKHYV